MTDKFRIASLSAIGWLLLYGGAELGEPPLKGAEKTVSAENVSNKANAALWRDPGDITKLNLFYGRGGTADQPSSGKFQFEKEDKNGTNPKIIVHDTAGTKWKIKLGDEARPETVASRFVWAAGYFTDIDYFRATVTVEGLPDHLRRGNDLVNPGGVLLNARLERETPADKKVGGWKWKTNPFTGTREWNGLRVLMALINNWDLKDENNGVYEITETDASGHEQKVRVYGVSDLGASFGASNLDLGRKSDKGNLDIYQKTSFIEHIGPDTVDFRAPGSPSPVMIFDPKSYFSRRGLMWIGRDIPRADARWIGSILGRLSPEQIRDAFRAGGYSYGEIEDFTAIMKQRIAALNAL